MYNPRLSAARSVRLSVFRARHPCEVLAILFWGLLSPIQTDETCQAHTKPPNFRPPRLGRGTTQGLWSINQKQYSFILGRWSLVHGPKLLDRKFHQGYFHLGFCLCVKRQCGHHAAQPSTLHIAGQSSLAPWIADRGSRPLRNSHTFVVSATCDASGVRIFLVQLRNQGDLTVARL